MIPRDLYLQKYIFRSLLVFEMARSWLPYSMYLPFILIAIRKE